MAEMAVRAIILPVLRTQHQMQALFFSVVVVVFLMPCSS